MQVKRFTKVLVEAYSLKGENKMKKSIFAIACALLTTALVGGIHNEVSAPAENNVVAKADYTTFKPQGDLYGGINFSVEYAENDITPEILVRPTNADLGQNGMYIRIKNNTAIETPIVFNMNSTTSYRVNLKVLGTYHLYDANGNYTGPHANVRDWGTYLMLPASFDGWMHITHDTFKDCGYDNTGKVMNWNSIWGIYIGLAAHYDSFANFVIGDIVTETSTFLDVSSLADDQITTAYDASKNVSAAVSAEYINLSRAKTLDEIMTPIIDLTNSLDTCTEYDRVDEITVLYNKLTESEKAIYEATLCEGSDTYTMGHKYQYMLELKAAATKEAGSNTNLLSSISNDSSSMFVILVGVLGLSLIAGYYFLNKKRFAK